MRRAWGGGCVERECRPSARVTPLLQPRRRVVPGPALEAAPRRGAPETCGAARPWSTFARERAGRTLLAGDGAHARARAPFAAGARSGPARAPSDGRTRPRARPIAAGARSGPACAPSDGRTGVTWPRPPGPSSHGPAGAPKVGDSRTRPNRPAGEHRMAMAVAGPADRCVDAPDRARSRRGRLIFHRSAGAGRSAPYKRGPGPLGPLAPSGRSPPRARPPRAARCRPVGIRGHPALGSTPAQREAPLAGLVSFGTHAAFV
jgi:hypothetical protein